MSSAAAPPASAYEPSAPTASYSSQQHRGRAAEADGRAKPRRIGRPKEPHRSVEHNPNVTATSTATTVARVSSAPETPPSRSANRAALVVPPPLGGRLLSRAPSRIP